MQAYTRRDVILAAAGTLAGVELGEPASAGVSLTGSGNNAWRQDQVLWCGTVRAKPFHERLAAAKAGGFSRMTIFPVDCRVFAAQGLPPQELRARAADAGIRITCLDPFVQWLPNSHPPAYWQDSFKAFVDFDETEFFRLAEALQVESINVIESFGYSYPAEIAAESFGRLCDRAAQNGWNVHLEFMPIGGIPDLATAWDIVRLADRKNGGILLDTWHYYRGRPNLKLLQKIPGDKMFAVQLADAKQRMQAEIFDDLLHHRLVPGEGEFDLTGLIQILATKRGIRSVGVEIFSDRFDAMAAQSAGVLAGEGGRAVIRRALDA